MIWILTTPDENGEREPGGEFVQVRPETLAEIARAYPGEEELLGRLGPGGPGAEGEEIERLYQFFERVWDRSQGALAERILKDPAVSAEPSRRAKVVARRLQKAVANDPRMRELDDLLVFLGRAREREGVGLSVVST